MSKNRKNIYARKAKQRSFMGLGSASAAVTTKGDFKHTMAFTGRDLLIGGLGGALAGALAGRSSLLIGAAVTGAAHYFGSPTASVFGVGMMASGGYQTVSGMSGFEKDGMEVIKERFSNFQNNLKRQLFLDKILPKKKASEDDGTNGLGSVQYFRHGEDVSGLDFTEANRIEEQIRDSARQFEARHAVAGADDDMSGFEGIEGVEGIDGVDGIDGLEERLM